MPRHLLHLLLLLCLLPLRCKTKSPPGSSEGIFSKEQLRQARSVTISRDPIAQLEARQRTLRDPAAIARLVELLDFTEAPACGCSSSHRVSFALDAGREAVLVVMGPNWSFKPATGKMATDRSDPGGRLRGHLDALLGFKPPPEVIKKLHHQTGCRFIAMENWFSGPIITGSCRHTRSNKPRKFACSPGQKGTIHCRLQADESRR